MFDFNLDELVIASSNKDKFTEIQDLLNPIKCISQDIYNIPSVAETGETFIENALIKARHTAAIVNKPVLADDSGLVVCALDGKPGVHSARFAGEDATSKDNIKLLLDKMSEIPFAQRQAYFYCVLILLRASNDPAPIIATGKLSGFISQEIKGNKGFGYDPVFFLPQYHCNVAELPLQIKNQISHRAIALNKLLTKIKKHDEY